MLGRNHVTVKVPQPYMSPVGVSAKLQLSPTATWTNTVLSGKAVAGIGYISLDLKII